MPRKHLLLVLLLLVSGCAEQPDLTTRAIATADQTGGICSAETIALTTGFAGQSYDCEDRSMRQISALVFNAPE
jgi:hypothetical protein